MNIPIFPYSTPRRGKVEYFAGMQGINAVTGREWTGINIPSIPFRGWNIGIICNAG
jgi:hypothetical protein